MALYQSPLQNNLQYTLNTQLAQGGSTAVLSASVAGVVQAPGVFVVDRVDSAGNKTASVREYISFTGVSGANLTGLTRGLGGSTDQVHNVGAVVEFVADVVWANAIYSAITLEHGVTGQHVSLASVSGINTQNLVIPSAASINFLNVQQIIFGGKVSLASVQDVVITNSLTASGASLRGFSVRPVWAFGGTLSGATAALGFNIKMDRPGTIQYIDALTRIGSSNASVGFDILKNGTGILGGTNVLSIPVNGTYVSTASISATNAQFVEGDVFNFSILNAGSFAQDLLVKFHAR